MGSSEPNRGDLLHWLFEQWDHLRIIAKGNRVAVHNWHRRGCWMVDRGELANLTIESEYGYGKSGYPPIIAGNAALKFQIEPALMTGRPSAFP
jgi:hypothetical protein